MSASAPADALATNVPFLSWRMNPVNTARHVWRIYIHYVHASFPRVSRRSTSRMKLLCLKVPACSRCPQEMLESGVITRGDLPEARPAGAYTDDTALSIAMVRRVVAAAAFLSRVPRYARYPRVQLHALLVCTGRQRVYLGGKTVCRTDPCFNSCGMVACFNARFHPSACACRTDPERFGTAAVRIQAR